MSDQKKKILRIIIAVVICLIIIAIPLTIKFVGESLQDKNDDIISPDADKPSPEDDAVAKKDITVSVSIEANALFGEEGKQYIDSIKKLMGEELFAALNEGNILPSIQIVVKEGSTIRDVMYAVERQLGIKVNGSYTYIAAIAGLAEKMASPSSGWVYTLNTKKIMVGVGSCIVHDGDSIEWHYVLGI